MKFYTKNVESLKIVKFVNIYRQIYKVSVYALTFIRYARKN